VTFHLLRRDADVREDTMLQQRKGLLIGLGAGIGLMYLLDPERGRRRRALLRDRLTRGGHTSAVSMRARGRDLAHRATGVMARLRAAVTAAPVDDVVLVERVRARLGRLVSTPHAVEVHAADGVVTLRGPILQDEVDRLVAGVARVSGVREVVDSLDAHDTAGSIPALQGAAERAR
jgi:hypothetical protein